MENPIHQGNLTFPLSFILHPVLLSTGIMTDVIIIALHKDTPTGRDMTTGITLTGRILAGLTITTDNTIPGKTETDDTTGVTTGGKKESPLTKNIYQRAPFIQLFYLVYPNIFSILCAVCCFAYSQSTNLPFRS